MARKEVKDSHNKTDVRFIAATRNMTDFQWAAWLTAVLIAVAMILMVVLPLRWPM